MAETAPQISPEKDLQPWNISLRDIQDPKLRAEAQKRLNTWLDELQKLIYELLQKNGITTFQISFSHSGTKTPILLHHGHTYNCAKLAQVAALTLKERVLEELNLDPPHTNRTNIPEETNSHKSETED
jgi:hypothetical protein